jgi:hypothetical protein
MYISISLIGVLCSFLARKRKAPAVLINGRKARTATEKRQIKNQSEQARRDTLNGFKAIIKQLLPVVWRQVRKTARNSHFYHCS